MVRLGRRAAEADAHEDRQKSANLANEPRVALSIADPDDPYRFLEVRGRLEGIEDDDAQASFYRSLQARYGKDNPITDADVRIILTIRLEAFVTVRNGKVVSG